MPTVSQEALLCLVKFVAERRKKPRANYGMEENTPRTANPATFLARENCLASNKETVINAGKNQ